MNKSYTDRKYIVLLHLVMHYSQIVINADKSLILEV